MDIEERTVAIPRKANTTKDESPTTVWPLVESALDKVEADESTREAARAAMEQSDGCVTLANYLMVQADQVQKSDFRFKVPLLVLGAELAEEDDGVSSVYDPEEGMMYYETDDHQFAFPVDQDWTVDWEDVADEIQEGYPWTGGDTEVWALDWLMAYQEVPLDDYMVDDEDEEEESDNRISRL